MNVILIGYMGSGKSTLGKKLSERLAYEYIDLDDFIVKEEGKTIAEIFKNKGELHFRKIESHYLSEVLKSHNAVISLGGGTPCYGNNMDTIKKSKNAFSIYLKASVFDLSERLFPEKDGRPLISHLDEKGQLIEFIGKHLFERAYFYNQSDITVNTGDKTVEEIVEEILLKLL